MLISYYRELLQFLFCFVLFFSIKRLEWLCNVAFKKPMRSFYCSLLCSSLFYLSSARELS